MTPTTAATRTSTPTDDGREQAATSHRGAGPVAATPDPTAIPLRQPGEAIDVARLEDGAELDVLVIGGGGAGLSAAVYAAAAGLRTALVERTRHVGGTTAFTAGTTWIPVNSHAAEVGADDSIEEADRFLDASVRGRSPKAVRDAYVRLGDEAVRTMEASSAVRYRARPKHPDYLSQLPGSRLAGRALEPETFDGRRLGDRMDLVRPALPEFTMFGGMMLERDDIAHFLGAHPTDESRRHLLALRRRYRDDLRAWGRDTRMTMGNGLIAALLHTLDERRVPVLVSSEVTRLERSGTAAGTASGRGDEGGFDATITTPSGTIRVRAANVVLASGGFNRHPERRARLLPDHDLEWCPGAPGHTGQAHDLADELGGVYGRGALANAYFAPVSRRQRADGSWAVFPHFVMDRAKPRMIVVDGRGRRYLNEATSYHLFGVEMVAHEAEDYRSTPSFLVTDAEGMRRYGLGMVHPFANERRLRPFLDDGYLVRADTLGGVARALDIDGAALEATVARYNEHAVDGEDPGFAKGSTDYQRFNGDAASPTGNPNVGPLEAGPYYAVRLYPGDIGAATGYETDEHAAALDRRGERIAGLYAIGNDMQSALGGTYPAPGITLGPGLVFAFAAVRDIASRTAPRAACAEPAAAASGAADAVPASLAATPPTA